MRQASLERPTNTSLDKALELYCDRQRILRQEEIRRRQVEMLSDCRIHNRETELLVSDQQSMRFLDALLHD
jgi:hypothetical protein